jgi:hypothetical protein
MKESVLVRRIVGLVSMVAVVSIAQAAFGQEFSADVVSTRGHSALSKIYSTKDKVRFEVEGRSPSVGPTSIIIDETQNKWVVLMPQRHLYMDSVPGMMKTPIITHFWHVEDVNDACPQWKKIAEQAGAGDYWGSCAKVGSDTVNGRSTVKYEGVSAKGEKTHFWLDTKLHSIIKAENDSGAMELENIQEGPQPASLFEVPAGYTKLDLGAVTRPQ